MGRCVRNESCEGSSSAMVMTVDSGFIGSEKKSTPERQFVCPAVALLKKIQTGKNKQAKTNFCMYKSICGVQCKRILCLLLACSCISSALTLEIPNNTETSSLGDYEPLVPGKRGGDGIDQNVALNNKSLIFISRVFNRYNDNEEYMKIEGFVSLLKNLGLEKAVSVDNHEGHDHHDHEGHNHGDDHIAHGHNDKHDEEYETGRNTTSSNSNNITQERSKRHVDNVPDVYNQCLSMENIINIFGKPKDNPLTVIDFLQICPALLDQLDGGYCKSHTHTRPRVVDMKPSSTSQTPAEDGKDDDEGEEDPGRALRKSPSLKRVWLFTFASVAVISVFSMIGALIIPNKRRVFYNHMLQFMVALAVGTMLSDTMLHLIPHGLLYENEESNHDHKGHKAGMYKGLMALLGLYSFFFLERLFTIFTTTRKNRKTRTKKEALRLRSELEAGDPGSMTMLNNSNLQTKPSAHNEPSCEDVVMVVHPNKAIKGLADEAHEEYLHQCDKTPVTSSPAETAKSAAFDDEDDVEVGFMDHGHSHSHTGPLSSVALMIVLGDGLHNFADGVVIAAAFCGSLAGGLSTSIAVLCHELPHEIGDFAVLVRSGMTVRRALFCNMLSSLPCFLGALIALLLGQVVELQPWIFTWMAGNFLYISLAVMIPEMSQVYTKCDEPWYLHLLLQACGMALGTTLMLILSASEEKLMKVFV